MQSSLFALYPPIIVPVLSEWINGIDLGHLDNAVCNHKQRSVFLSWLSKTCLTNCVISNLSSSELYTWVDLRAVDLKKLVVSEDDYKLPDVMSVMARINHLSSLTSMDCPDLRSKLSNDLRVNSLTLTYLKSFDITECLFSIRELDVSRLVNIPDEVFFTRIAEHCPDLEVLKVHYSFRNVIAVFDVPKLRIVQGCNLFPLLNTRGRVRGMKPKCPYHGDIKRVDQLDASAVTIKDKHFHIVTITIQRVDDETFELIEPYLKNLNSATIRQKEPVLTDTLLLKCSRLTHLNAVWDFTDEAILSLIQQSPLLRKVEVPRCNKKAALVLKHLMDSCEDLEELHIDGVRLPEANVAHAFKKLKSLTSVNVASRGPTDLMVRQLAVNLHALALDNFSGGTKIENGRGGRTLHVGSKHVTGYFNFRRVFARNPMLSKVTFDGLGYLTDQKLKQLVENCPLLMDVTVARCPKLTMNGLRHFARCKHLAKFTINKHEVTSDFIRELLTDKPSFVKLSLLNCGACNTSEITSVIVGVCPQLQYLHISRNFTNADVIVLLQGCPNLDSLDISCCFSATAEILPYLEPKMRHLNLAGTSVMENEWNDFVANTGFACSHSLVF